MQKLELDVWERAALIAVVRAPQKGAMDLKEVKHRLRILDRIELTSEEKKRANLHMDGNLLSWDAEAEFSATVELEDADFEVLQNLVRSYRTWAVNSRVVALAEKLGL